MAAMGRWVMVALVAMMGSAVWAQEDVDTAPVDGGESAEVPQVEGDTGDSSGYRPPEIDVGGLTGLLVAALLLTVFAIGFMTLFAIQTPQRFEVPEKDTKNKNA